MQQTAGAYLLQFGYFNSAQFSIVREAVPKYCKMMKEDAVPLVDAFNLSDFVIGSPLGRYDGDIYRAYFDKVKRSRTRNKNGG